MSLSPGRGPAPAEELAGGSDRPGRRGRRTAGLVALLVVALLGTGAEQWESRRQLDALLVAAADVERVVQDSRRSLSGVAGYSAALLARPDLGPEQRAAVLSTFAEDARRFPPRTAPARVALEQVRPLPWDRELHAARKACLARLDAWTAVVEDGQDEPLLLLQERRTTRAEREAAAGALRAAAGGRAAEQVDSLRQSLLRR
jgi:hypothetical protein